MSEALKDLYKEIERHQNHEIECYVPDGKKKPSLDGLRIIRCLDCKEDLITLTEEEECEDLTVWELKIFEPGVTRSYPFREESSAWRQLYNYVEQRWPDTFPDVTIPDNADDAINMYFPDLACAGYTICQREVLCEAQPE